MIKQSENLKIKIFQTNINVSLNVTARVRIDGDYGRAKRSENKRELLYSTA